MREKKLIRVLNEIEFETRQAYFGTNSAYIIKESTYVELVPNLYIKIGKFRGYFKLH